jgi:hypothetical protein
MWLTTSSDGLLSNTGREVVYNILIPQTFGSTVRIFTGTAPLGTGPVFTHIGVRASSPKRDARRFSVGHSPTPIISPIRLSSILSLTKGRDARRFGVFGFRASSPKRDARRFSVDPSVNWGDYLPVIFQPMVA